MQDQDVSVKVVKQWLDENGNVTADNLPEKIEVQLIRRDEKGGRYPLETAILSVENNWEYEFESLPSKGVINGEILDFSYIVEEKPIIGFDAVYELTEPSESTKPYIFTTTITNKKTPLIDIPVEKVWNDADNQDGLRPESITVQLYGNGAAISSKMLILNKENSWKGEFTNLPVNKAGEKIKYTVVEVQVPERYTGSVAGDVESGFTITNTHNPAITAIPVEKVWNDADNQDGLRPESITVQLYGNGAAISSKTLILNKENSWKGEFTNLPVNKAGEKIEYTVVEVQVPEGYTGSVAGDVESGFTITNVHTPMPTPSPTPKVTEPPIPPTPTYPTIKIPLSVNKVLRNGSLKGGEFKFQLTDRHGKVIAEATNAADGKVVFPERTFSKVVSNWTYTIREVPGNDSDIVYDKTIYTVKISTKAVDGKLGATVDIEKDGTPYAGNMTFTNTRNVPKTGDNTYKTIGLILVLALMLFIGAYASNFKNRIINSSRK